MGIFRGICQIIRRKKQFKSKKINFNKNRTYVCVFEPEYHTKCGIPQDKTLKHT